MSNYSIPIEQNKVLTESRFIPIPWFDDYWASEDGEIGSSKKQSSRIKIIGGGIGSKGYRQVGLMTEGCLKTHSVHRLIAITFLPNPDNLPQVNHKDGNKMNNCVSNLEWVTARENMAHASASKLLKPAKGGDHSSSKLTESDVLSIRQEYIDGESIVNISVKYGISMLYVRSIARSYRWKHLPSCSLQHSRIKGENNHKSKLTACQVLQIRSLYLTGLSVTEMSKTYGCSAQNISRIISRRIWKHI